jgi:hypothetical protein
VFYRLAEYQKKNTCDLYSLPDVRDGLAGKE